MLTHPQLTPAKLPAKRTATTPLGWAKRWARSNATYIGILKITTKTPAGKGGWKTTRKTSTYFVSGGLAAQRGEHRDPAKTRRYWSNGVCEACGRLMLDKLLTVAIDPAGGWLVSCVPCTFKFNLRLDPSAADWRVVRFDKARAVSTLAIHSEANLPVTKFSPAELHPLTTAPDGGGVVPHTVEAELSGAVPSGA